MLLDTADVVIIGAGVTGMSSAWWLAKQGVDVVVVDKGLVGWEASGRNGGIVSHRVSEPPVIPLAAESLRLWPTMDEELGYPTEFRAGSIGVILDEAGLEQREVSRKRLARFGIESRPMDAKEVRDMLALVNPKCLGGSFSPRSGHANPQRSVQAFAWAFQDHGGRIYQNAKVIGITVEGDRVTAVETERGTVNAGFVVAAAGPQTAIITDMVGTTIPIAPARVEIAVTAPVEHMWQGSVSGAGLYGRQTLRGNLAYGGGPHEWIDVDNATPRKPNTPLVRNLARHIAELFSGAADVPLIRSWAGVVEQTPDYFPIIEVLDHPSNYLVATMSAHGFGLSPATGKVISDLVLHGETSVDISGLRLGRFADVPSNWREERGWVAAPERA